jgi:WD40 repeat protein
MLATLAGHTQTITQIAYSRNGVLVATGSNDGTVRVWDPRTGRLLRTQQRLRNPDALMALAKTRVTRQLTPAENRTYLGS